MSRMINFSAGPAALPEEVLQQAQAELTDYQSCGMSIMEVSHRGKEYMGVHAEAAETMKRLMGLGDDHAVLLLQGGATGQFAMIPANLLGEGQTADYVNGGAWSTKAIKAAKTLGNVNVAGDTAKDIPTCMPDNDSLTLTEGAAYLHVCSNETISGAQYKEFPKSDAPLIVDMSSDILSRPLDFSSFGMIYAGAQKNLGPSGVTLVAIRKDLVERAPDSVPGIWRYKDHMENDSMLNTPPCFAIYMLMLVGRWIEKQGGLAAVADVNRSKAQALYDAIDGTEFYRGTALPEYRSDMNVTYRLPSEDLESEFVKAALAEGMSGLKGHRSVGGIRASIYNAMPRAGVDALISFMKEFEAAKG